MSIAAFCYAYGIFNGSTRRARIQPRSSFTKQHRGELLSYTASFLSYFAVQIYEFGFRSDTMVTQLVYEPELLRLGWSAECVRFSSLVVAPSVLFLLAPTLRTKLRKLLSDCWAAVGCAGEESDGDGERRAGLFTTLRQDFWKDPLGNCFRFITCRRIPLEGDSSSPDSELDLVDQSRDSRLTGHHNHNNVDPPDLRHVHAPPPPYSFLHSINADGSLPSYTSDMASTDTGRRQGDEHYFLVSGILSVAIPPRGAGSGVAEAAPAYQDISPPPSYEEAMQGIDGGRINNTHAPPTSSSTSVSNTTTAPLITNTSQAVSPQFINPPTISDTTLSSARDLAELTTSSSSMPSLPSVVTSSLLPSACPNNPLGSSFPSSLPTPTIPSSEPCSNFSHPSHLLLRSSSSASPPRQTDPRETAAAVAATFVVSAAAASAVTPSPGQSLTLSPPRPYANGQQVARDLSTSLDATANAQISSSTSCDASGK
ncbi:hypothetical protein PoB_002887900 [Plakobranchus ocellatus]|uniref:Uncharacterized protein n=1 Tax=Plakobranchus ocellatus TaxID=259542 RepID=A0AAV4A3W2_9GAST|nr:hypothetical protein PoB_002887900 [Plakobranchus ocellatus]